MMTNDSRLLRAGLAFLIAFGSSVGDLRAQHGDGSPIGSSETCSAASRRVPPTVTIDRELRMQVAKMLAESATFRDQCRRIADAPRLHVRVRLSPLISQTTCRARSVIQHTSSGIIVAIVEIGPWGNPTPWIAHEFEHLLEQLEGIRLDDRARHSRDVWRTNGEMFETERAIRAGRTVADEMNRKRPPSDKSVE